MTILIKYSLLNSAFRALKMSLVLSSQPYLLSLDLLSLSLALPSAWTSVLAFFFQPDTT